MAFNRPLHEESDISSNVVAEPGDENVASNEPPLRLCNDGDFGITRVIVVAPTALGMWAGRGGATGVGVGVDTVVIGFRVTLLTVAPAAVVVVTVMLALGNDLASVEVLLEIFGVFIGGFEDFFVETVVEIDAFDLLAADEDKDEQDVEDDDEQEEEDDDEDDDDEDDDELEDDDEWLDLFIKIGGLELEIV